MDVGIWMNRKIADWTTVNIYSLQVVIQPLRSAIGNGPERIQQGAMSKYGRWAQSINILQDLVRLVHTPNKTDIWSV
jgi:hypothetical protein